MECKLVSVIMPTCNEYIYLEKAVNSILQQSYQNLEIIIIDSSDDVEKTKLLVHLEDQRIHYYYRKKNGIADALNYGIQIAKGDYIARMDADDIADFMRIEKQVKFLEKNAEISVLGTSFEIIDESDNIKGRIHHPISHDEIFAKLLFENAMCHPSVMFRKHVFIDGYRYRNMFSEDYDLWTRLILDYKFANLPECLLKYRVHGTNISIVGNEKVRKSVCESTKEFFDRILGKENLQYQDIDYLKNESFQWIESQIHNYKNAFFFRQFELIKQLQIANNQMKLADEAIWNKELNKRWNLLWGLTSVMRPSTQKLIDNYCSVMDYHIVKYEYMQNEMKIQTELLKSKSFYLYGYGIRGKATLKKLENIKEKLKWKLEGVLDQKEQTYCYNGKEKNTVLAETVDFQSCDYILISSKNYYEDIKSKLILLGVSGDKIISDSIVYYI